MIHIGKLISIGILVISLTIGLLAFYLFHPGEKAAKKKMLHELVSQLINFILFIWLGKVIWNLPVFIRDPLAVLAYPSDAMSFYIAVILIALVLAYKSIQKQLAILPFLQASLPVILVASFVYEFLQLIVGDHTYNFGYLLLLGVLLAGLILLRIEKDKMLLLFTIWMAGVLVLHAVQPFVTLFGYIIHPWFIVIFYTGTILFIRS